MRNFISEVKKEYKWQKFIEPQQRKVKERKSHDTTMDMLNFPSLNNVLLFWSLTLRDKAFYLIVQFILIPAINIYDWWKK